MGLTSLLTGLLVVFLVAEECYWLALSACGHRGSTFTSRLLVQVFALSLTALVLLGMAGLAEPLIAVALRLREGFGLRLDPGFPARVVAFLAAGDLKSAANLALVQHAAFVGGLHALASFGAAALLIRNLGAPRNAFVSVAAAAMIFGALYMALKPATAARNASADPSRSVQLTGS